MSSEIPDNFRDLLNKKAFGQLATIMADGTPQVTNGSKLKLSGGAILATPDPRPESSGSEYSQSKVI